MIIVKLEFERLLLTYVNMAAGAAALFFYLGEIGALVPVGFGVVVVGDSVEARRFGGAACNDGVGHAHDGGRVHAAAQLSENRAVRTQPAADGFGEDGAEVFFVLTIGAVADTLGGIEIPVLANGVPSRAEQHRRRRRNGMDADVGRQVRGGKEREPAGDVLFAEREGSSSEEDQ